MPLINHKKPSLSGLVPSAHGRKSGRNSGEGGAHDWICLLLHPRDSFTIFPAKVFNFSALSLIIAGGFVTWKPFERNRLGEANLCNVFFILFLMSFVQCIILFYFIFLMSCRFLRCHLTQPDKTAWVQDFALNTLLPRESGGRSGGNC